jgi:hypothetical protein
MSDNAQRIIIAPNYLKKHGAAARLRRVDATLRQVWHLIDRNVAASGVSDGSCSSTSQVGTFTLRCRMSSESCRFFVRRLLIICEKVDAVSDFE